MSLNTWSSAGLTQSEWSSYCKDSIGQHATSFTDDPEVIEYFTVGQCGALAYELHKLTGWTLVLLSTLPVGDRGLTGHVFVIDSDGMAIDIKGKRTIDEIKEDWDFCHYLHRFWDLKDFKKEMDGWYFSPRYDRDKEAKYWAKFILEQIDF